ncbi:hypothetical protein [Lysobacter gummosus]|uniref:hypothetical protein n=1 Tax=Lysobacter gummosus TaxID=262324 RepID=UPI0036361436
MDAGFASSAEMLATLSSPMTSKSLMTSLASCFMQPGSRLAARVFVWPPRFAASHTRLLRGYAIGPAAATAGRDPRSVPTRHARRRLHAGPTPAALPPQSSLELGLPHHH